MVASAAVATATAVVATETAAVAVALVTVAVSSSSLPVGDEGGDGVGDGGATVVVTEVARWRRW